MKVPEPCPSMLGMIEVFRPIFSQKFVELTAPKVVQTLSIEHKIFESHNGSNTEDAAMGTQQSFIIDRGWV